MAKKLLNGRCSVAALLVALLVTGCVTTTDNRFSREADRQKAVDNYVELASAYIGQGNIERARHHLDRALEIEPNSPQALAALGLIYNADGESELAEENFKKAISKDSGYTRARVYYGAFLYSKQRFAEARDQFSAASRDTSYKDRGSVFYNLGMTQERLGEQDDAIVSYRRASELTRGDARSLLSLSRVMVESGDVAGAKRYYDRLLLIMQRNLNLQHSPESLFTGIRIARYSGDRNQEASLALQLKNKYPESVEYQQYKALIAND
ncbi:MULTISPECIES: type IV pilus biogenesis/stability protein PilW [Marinobacter]|uniref:Type IV pilus biogenesis/stability protein PilW n=1 Tax=Marinobacter xiaoshiensis TaxID=3073652 RepID=A0ABU2HHJ9_9GAMM|nr:MULTISPECIES: type IV pilus biogenesis/stability protein PilW [unclassified Marinobacter]MBK1874862.1 type IV pilus biogenesis/stability protein PilW [Marinobacter sp. 1-3A]MDS1310036.1 type IV pilus biogenesis/stability protein PilW [Marinobacter sp. F60267]